MGHLVILLIYHQRGFSIKGPFLPLIQLVDWNESRTPLRRNSCLPTRQHTAAISVLRCSNFDFEWQNLQCHIQNIYKRTLRKYSKINGECIYNKRTKNMYRIALEKAIIKDSWVSLRISVILCYMKFRSWHTIHLGWKWAFKRPINYYSR